MVFGEGQLTGAGNEFRKAHEKGQPSRPPCFLKRNTLLTPYN